VPTITARFWAIYDAQRKTFIHGHREYIKRECASLTKMMTALVSVKLCKKFKLDIRKEAVKVTGVASNIRGTTANLKKGDVLSVE
jgi:D-alanyl-D-alanine carboxypeptidase